MKKIFIVSALFLTTLLASAQEKFEEGTVTFSADWQVPEGMPPQIKEAMPKEVSVFVKGSRSSTKIDIKMMGMEMNMKILYNSQPMEMLMLMDMMGQKMGIKTSEADIKKIRDTTKVSFEYLDFKKNIAGYECKKVLMHNKNTGDVTEMFITEQIECPALKSDVVFTELKGVPLEYIQNQNGMKVKMTAIKLTKGAVDEKLFEVPSDYNIMTIEEAAKMIPKN